MKREYTLQDIVDEVAARGRGEPGTMTDADLCEAALAACRELLKISAAAQRHEVN